MHSIIIIYHTYIWSIAFSHDRGQQGLKLSGLWSMVDETPAHGLNAEIHVSTYAAGRQLTPNPWGYPRA